MDLVEFLLDTGQVMPCPYLYLLASTHYSKSYDFKFHFTSLSSSSDVLLFLFFFLLCEVLV